MKIKRKGAYGHSTDLAWHQNHSAQVISKAVESFLMTGQPVETFIRNHKDPFDFMLRTKVPRDSNLVISPNDKQLQNITRYYASVGGGFLTKIMPPTGAQLLAAEFPQYLVLSKPGKPDLIVTKQKVYEDAIGKGYVFSHCGNAKAPDRRMSIEAGQTVTPCNNMDDFGQNPIDYQYYIEEAYKLVRPLL